MAGLLNNKDQKNTQDSVTDGATGVAKTGTGSMCYSLPYLPHYLEFLNFEPQLTIETSPR